MISFSKGPFPYVSMCLRMFLCVFYTYFMYFFLTEGGGATKLRVTSMTTAVSMVMSVTFSLANQKVNSKIEFIFYLKFQRSMIKLNQRVNCCGTVCSYRAYFVYAG